MSSFDDFDYGPGGFTVADMTLEDVLRHLGVHDAPANEQRRVVSAALHEGSLPDVMASLIVGSDLYDPDA